LRVEHIANPQIFNATYKCTPGPDLLEDQHTKLVVDGRAKTKKKYGTSVRKKPRIFCAWNGRSAAYDLMPMHYHISIGSIIEKLTLRMRSGQHAFPDSLSKM
jgi:hypothetical protein